MLFRLIIYVENIENLPTLHQQNSFNLPTLTIPPALGPEDPDFSRRLPRGRMVADKKEQRF